MENPLLGALLDAAFHFVCTRRVGELIDAEHVLVMLDHAATATRNERWLARLFAPARERLLARASASSEKLGTWLPESAKAALSDLLGQPAPIPREIIDQVLASERVREDVRAMLKETLESFIAKAFAVAPGGRG